MGAKRKKMPMVDLSTDLAFASPPSWHTGFQEVAMGDTAIVNAQLPEAVRVGSGFVVKAALRTGLKIENYEVVVRGVSAPFTNTFQDVHLFSDGAVNSTIANNRPFLIDYHFVRLHPNIQPGRYQIFWSLRHIETKKPLLTGRGEDSVFLGSLHILPEGLPSKASGIDWDGNLPKELRDNFAEEFTETPESGVFEFIFNEMTGKPQHQSGLSFFAYEQKYRISPSKHFVYLTIANGDHAIRWGCTRKNLKTAVARNIDKICGRNDFQTVLQSGDENITLKLEIIIAEAKIDPKEQQTANMACRGMKLERDDRSYILLPSEAYDKKMLSFEQQFAHLVALHDIDSPDDYSCYLLESIGHAFYRGRVSGHYE